MYDESQLNETFAAHEHLAPEAEAVLARANQIAKSYQRRRWAVRATGTAVLGAGIVAGGVALPGRGSHSGSVSSIAPAVGGQDASPSASPSPASWTTDQEMTAFFDAGYDYTDAQSLQTLWNDGKDINGTKAEAGLKLLEGDTLPVPPSGSPVAPANADVDAFFAAGYTYNDAVTLGGMWNETNTYQVKAEAGKKLLDGETLPIPPSGPADPSAGSAHVTQLSAAKIAKLEARAKAKGLRIGETLVVHGKASSSDDPSPSDSAALNEFFAKGYDYSDATKLGQLWNESDINQVKIDAGQKLLDGDTLPVKPTAQPETAENSDVAAFFAAGYTYDDAVQLGQLWNESDTYQVKADAGKKLLDGQTLPIAP